MLRRLILVDAGRIVTKESPGKFKCVLGSCLGIILYDPNRKIGSLAHTVLPSIIYASKRKKTLNLAKYVDSAIEEQLKELRTLRIRNKDLVAKIVGGASVLPTRHLSHFNIGNQNIEVCIKKLKENEIPIVGKDLGKEFGREIFFNLENGMVTIKKANGTLWKVI